jgi:adenylate kinase
MVAEALRNAPYDMGCLLDGFPRSLPQAEALDQILAQEGKQVDMVLELDVGDEILIERLLARKRPDDTLDTIRNRLKVYMEQTSPVLSYYKERRLLTTINGEGTMDDVHREILEQTLQKNE